MTNTQISFAIDGSTDIDLFGAMWFWNGGYTSFLDLFFSDGTGTTAGYDADITLSGSWFTNGITFFGDDSDPDGATELPVNVTITDTDDGGDRFFDTMRLANGGGTFTGEFIFTNFQLLSAFGDGDVDLKLSNDGATGVFLGEGDDTFELASQFVGVGTVTTGAGWDDVILSGDGSTLFWVSTGEGRDELVISGSSGQVDSLDMGSGLDTLRASGEFAFVAQATMGLGNDLVEVSGDGAFIEVIRADRGKDVLKVTGDQAFVEYASMGFGDDIVEVTGNSAGIGQLDMGDDDDDVLVGSSSGITLLQLGFGLDSLTVQDGGFVGVVDSFEGSKTVTLGDNVFVGTLNVSGSEEREDENDPVVLANNVITTGAGSKIGAFNGGDGNDHLTIGGDADQLSLFGGTNTLDFTGDFIGTVAAYGGENTVDIDGGRIRAIGFSDGLDNVKLTNGARVDVMELGGEKDILTVRSGSRVDMADLGDGDNEIVVQGTESRIKSLITSDGDDDVKLFNGGYDPSEPDEDLDNRIDVMRLGNGEDKVRAYANTEIELVDTGDGADDLRWFSANSEEEGAFVRTILTGRDDDIVEFGDFVSAELIDTERGNDTVITGNDFIGKVRLGDGDDLLQQGSGEIEFIGAGEGNDTVELGQRTPWTVLLGQGDDLVKIVDAVSFFTTHIHGLQGNDTADFSGFSQGVTVDLKDSGFQNVAPDEDGDPTAGSFSLMSIENLVGSKFQDRLEGDNKDNVITGGAQRDKLFGNDGQDTLIGGSGRDTLTGGEDADTFEFKIGHGKNNRIKDFDISEDTIAFVGIQDFSEVTLSDVGSTGRALVEWENVSIQVENTTAAQLNDAGLFGL
ncbi:MAG: calcium-binding protein [Pseudomonadota bacterium]